MPTIRRLYCTPATFKRVVGIQDPWSDEMLMEALAAASQMVDDHCHRFFYELEGLVLVQTATVYDRLLIRGMDLVALSALATDDGTGAFATAWSESEYALEPASAPYQSPPRPYWEIVAAGDKRFVTGVNRVRLTGRFGFPLEWRTVSATVRNTATDPDPPAGINATTVTLPVSVDEEIEVGHTLKIGTEQLYVTRSISDDDGATLTVERGVNGTTAAEHDEDSAITVAEYVDSVKIACRIQANRYLHRPNAAFGVVGTVNVGDIRLSAKMDPDAVNALSALVRG